MAFTIELIFAVIAGYFIARFLWESIAKARNPLTANDLLARAFSAGPNLEQRIADYRALMETKVRYVFADGEKFSISRRHLEQTEGSAFIQDLIRHHGPIKSTVFDVTCDAYQRSLLVQRPGEK